MHVLGARPPDIIREIARGILKIFLYQYILLNENFIFPYCFYFFNCILFLLFCSFFPSALFSLPFVFSFPLLEAEGARRTGGGGGIQNQNKNSALMWGITFLQGE